MNPWQRVRKDLYVWVGRKDLTEMFHSVMFDPPCRMSFIPFDWFQPLSKHPPSQEPKYQKSIAKSLVFERKTVSSSLCLTGLAPGNPIHDRALSRNNHIYLATIASFHRNLQNALLKNRMDSCLQLLRKRCIFWLI